MADRNDLMALSGLSLEEGALKKLFLYREMLLDWNTRMDLTSVSDTETVQRHFLDSLLPLSFPGLIPEKGRLIDVGTGAGFPGMPLAIACPGLEVTLLEAQGKRCRFLEAVQSALELTNVQVIQERAEVLGRAEGHREGYDRAVARAVAPLNVLCEYLLPFVRTGGLALCWKGPAVFEEMEDGKSAALQVGGSVEEPIETALEERRHVVVPIRKMEKTLPQFPRKNGIPVKRPLKSGK